MRYRYYLRALIAAVSAAAAPANIFAGNVTSWSVEKYVDSFSGQAAFVTMKYDHDKLSGLALYCNPHYRSVTLEDAQNFEPYIHVHLITTMTNLPHVPDFVIQYRLDDNQVVRASIDAANGVFAFLEPKQAREFFEQLRNSSRVRFRIYSPNHSVYIDYDFSLDGIREAAEQLVDECNAYH
jgi:hypothetical protein